MALSAPKLICALVAYLTLLPPTSARNLYIPPQLLSSSTSTPWEHALLSTSTAVLPTSAATTQTVVLTTRSTVWITITDSRIPTTLTTTTTQAKAAAGGDHTWTPPSSSSSSSASIVPPPHSHTWTPPLPSSPTPSIPTSHSHTWVSPTTVVDTTSCSTFSLPSLSSFAVDTTTTAIPVEGNLCGCTADIRYFTFTVTTTERGTMTVTRNVPPGTSLRTHSHTWSG